MRDTIDIDDDDDGILDVNEIGDISLAPIDFSSLDFSMDEFGNRFNQDTDGIETVGVTFTTSTGGGFQGVSDGGFQGFFGNGNGNRTVTAQLDFDHATNFRLAADTNVDTDPTDGTSSNLSLIHISEPTRPY